MNLDGQTQFNLVLLSNTKVLDIVVLESEFGENDTQQNCHHCLCQFLQSKPELLRGKAFAAARQKLEVLW